MATTNSITTTYAGEAASGYISAALLSGRTLAQEGVVIKPNVKYKEVVRRVDASSIIKDGTCDFDPTGTVTMVERILEPKELQVNVQLCKSDYIPTWEAAQLGASAHNQVPSSFADYLIGHFGGLVAQATETSIWSGSDATNGQFDGFSTTLALDANLPAAQEVTGTTVTAANVIDELGKIVDAIPSSLFGAEDLYIYVSQNIWKAYVRALGGFGASGLGANGYRGEGTNQAISMPMFDGVNLFPAFGLGSNVAIAAQKSNLFFGTGLLSDHNNDVKVIDMADIDGSKNFRFVMNYTAGVQYGVVEDIVTYGITNSAN